MNNSDDEEGNFFEVLLLWIIATVCAAFLASLTGFVYILFQGIL
jgi:hypothetical protein